MLRRICLMISHSVMVALLLPLPLASAAPIVWSGPTTSFTKLPFADPTMPENQDPITPNVILTRGPSQGIFNIAQETFYTQNLSPKGTTWATGLNNSGKTIDASNWADLSFTSWQDAYGGPNQLATNITRMDAVVHLVDDDIYLNLKFDYWGQRADSGAAFSYLRSTIPEPSTLLLLAGGAGLQMLAIRKRRTVRDFD